MGKDKQLQREVWVVETKTSPDAAWETHEAHLLASLAYRRMERYRYQQEEWDFRVVRYLPEGDK